MYVCTGRSMTWRIFCLLKCQQWNSKVTPYMYKWIYVRRPNICKELHLSLSLSAESGISFHALSPFCSLSLSFHDDATTQLCAIFHGPISPPGSGFWSDFCSCKATLVLMVLVVVRERGKMTCQWRWCEREKGHTFASRSPRKWHWTRCRKGHHPNSRTIH